MCAFFVDADCSFLQKVLQSAVSCVLVRSSSLDNCCSGLDRTHWSAVCFKPLQSRVKYHSQLDEPAWRHTLWTLSPFCVLLNLTTRCFWQHVSLTLLPASFHLMSRTEGHCSRRNSENFFSLCLLKEISCNVAIFFCHHLLFYNLPYILHQVSVVRSLMP